MRPITGSYGLPSAHGGASIPPGDGFVAFGRRPAPERIATDVIGVVPGNRDGFVLLNTDGGLAPANGLAMADAGDLDGDGGADIAMTAPFTPAPPARRPGQRGRP